MSTREMIRDFSLAFERPVNQEYTALPVSDRILLGKLLLEEVVEYVTKGLGFTIAVSEQDNMPIFLTAETLQQGWNQLDIDHTEGDLANDIEIVDGLADVNVVAHFCAHWHGFNLDRATEIVHESNMSKLDADGKPIINGVTPGYRDAATVAGGAHRVDHCHFDEPGYDYSKPIGKILKSDRFFEPASQLNDLINHGHNRKEGE